jgi:hypothetical protein
LDNAPFGAPLPFLHFWEAIRIFVRASSWLAAELGRFCAAGTGEGCGIASESEAIQSGGEAWIASSL